MAGFFDCGFARVAVKESFKKANGNPLMDKAKRLEKYMAYFGGKNEGNFSVNQKTFNLKSVVLVNSFKKFFKNPEEKQNYVQHFSSQAWSNLSAVQRAVHSVSNCKACHLQHQSHQELFPIRSNYLKKSKLMHIATNELKGQENIKPTTAAIKETAKNLYNKINEPFKETFNIDFNKALAKVPQLHLQIKKGAAALKKERRQQVRQQKQKIEEHWQVIDVTTFLGTRQSFSQREKQRKAFCFESRQEAVMRSQKRKAQEEASVRVPKRHSPDPSSTDLDEKGLLEEVKKMNQGDIKFSYIQITLT